MDPSVLPIYKKTAELQTYSFSIQQHFVNAFNTLIAEAASVKQIYIFNLYLLRTHYTFVLAKTFSTSIEASSHATIVVRKLFVLIIPSLESNHCLLRGITAQ